MVDIPEKILSMETTALLWKDEVSEKTGKDTGTFVHIEQMYKILEKEMITQSDELLTEADSGNTSVLPEFQNKYIEGRNKVLSFISEKMAANIASTMFEEVVEDLVQEFSSGQIHEIRGKNNPAGDILNVDAKKGNFGGWVGGFIEEQWFGIDPHGNSAFPDVKSGVFPNPRLDVELKAHSSSENEVQVAGITMEGIPGNELDIERARKIGMAYRIFLKMQNFLLIKMDASSPVIEKNGVQTRRVRYESIMLSMTLILKKVWDLIFNQCLDQVKPGKDVFPFFTTKAKWKDGKVNFDIKIDIRKVDGVFNFLKLYLYHFDLLTEIKSNDETRKRFFAGLNDIKKDWKAKNLGTSPNFNFTIKP